MDTKAVTIPILLLGFLSLSACNFPGLQGGGEMDVPVATPTIAPIEATALPSPSPTTEALDPTQEPLPVTSETIPISIDNVKELVLQTQLQSELNNIHAAFDLSVDGQYIALSQWYVPENVVRIWDLE